MNHRERVKRGNDTEKERATKEISIPVNFENLNEAIEKANRLVELLKEASLIIDSLSGKN